MAASAMDNFKASLFSTGLVAQDEFAEFASSHAPEERLSDVQNLARALVKAKKLSRFQAKVLLQGKGESLTLGNYLIVNQLGVGGMGVVYKARHRRMDRMVALKILPKAATASRRRRERFEREVKAVARLSHPNIVTAFDADEAKGVHFLVMEYVDGKDLGAVVQEQGSLQVANALHYILQAARGIEYAHKSGVIHRDIKPANLLLDRSGVVKVLDLGLARIEQNADAEPGDSDDPDEPSPGKRWGEDNEAPPRAASELTQAGSTLGTFDYMAPEQSEDAKSADHRADIYSLGCSLWYLLTARAVYAPDGQPQYKMLAHRRDPIPSLRELCPDVSERLDAAFQKMIAKAPGDRHQSMTEVIADLEECLTETTGSAGWTPMADVAAGGSIADSASLFDSATTAESQSGSRTKTPSTGAGGFNRRWIGYAAIAVGIVCVVLLTFVIGRNRKADQPDVLAEKQTPTQRVSAGNNEESTTKVETIRPALPDRGPAESGFVDLFNGKDLTGWTVVGDVSAWWVKDGNLVATGQPEAQRGTWLATQSDYDNFDLRFEYKLSPGANSGVFLRSPRRRMDPKTELFEIQLQDDGDPRYAGQNDDQHSGAIYGILAPVQRVSTSTETWNSMRVRADGARLTVWLNDSEILAADLAALATSDPRAGGLARKSGAIGFQYQNNTVEFRNIVIKPLADGDSLSWSDRADSAWINLFNGNDLSGWTIVDERQQAWSVAGGNIVVQGDGRGHLWTEKQYDDFELELEYRLRSGSNSGVFLRSPMRAQPIYKTRRRRKVASGVVDSADAIEVAIFDNASLPARARGRREIYDGAVYGVSPPLRDAGKPIGQWNNMLIHAFGRHLTVQLNGQTVQDVDLDQLAAANSNRPGLRRSTGHIGLQHWGTSRAEFRNIHIKPLSNKNAWIDLFNGRDLNGWDGDPALWSVEDGTIVGRTKTNRNVRANSYLIWRGGTPADFELRLQLKLDNGNTGIQYRSREINKWVMGGYQADFESGEQFSGVLYDERGRGILAQRGQKVVISPRGKLLAAAGSNSADAIQAAIRPGDWNDYTIIAHGNHLVHEINGRIAVEVTDNDAKQSARSGLLGLQLHRGPPMTVRFRNISLRNLTAPPTEGGQ